MKKSFFIALLTLIFSISQAQVSGNGISEYSAQGRLVILRIVPGDKISKLFIVGKKVAELDLKKDAKVLAVFLDQQGKSEELRINDRGDFYEVRGLPNEKRPYKLSVRTEVKGQKDEVTFKINMQKP